MRNPLSNTIVNIKPSGIRKFFDIAAEMDDVISLGVGEPDFDTPWHVRDEGIYSLEKGRTSYTSNAGLKELKRNYPRIKIVINEDEKDALTDDTINMCSYLSLPENYIEADITVKEGDTIEFGNLKAQIIHTPGHTAGSMSILIKDAVFTGDTLFKRVYGRTDLKTGSEREIMWSIKDKLLKLPENTIVYPGHGAITIIREEKEHYEEENR